MTDEDVANLNAAFEWASMLNLHNLHWMVLIMAADANALTPMERKAVLEVVGMKLGRELRKEGEYA